MSRFNTQAYDKLYPRVTDPDPVPETAVETFRPSQEKITEDTPKVDTVIPEVEDPLLDDFVYQDVGGEDGDGEFSKSDPE